MAWIRDIRHSDSATAATSFTPDLPQHESGDWLMWFIKATNIDAITPDTGWTVDDEDDQTLIRVQLQSHVATSSSETAPTATSTSSRDWFTTVVSVADAPAVSPIDVTGTQSGNGTPTAPSITALSDDCLYFGFVANQNESDRTTPPNGVRLHLQTGGRMLISHAALSTGDTIPAQTLDVHRNRNYASISALVKSSSGSPPLVTGGITRLDEVGESGNPWVTMLIDGQTVDGISALDATSGAALVSTPIAINLFTRQYRVSVNSSSSPQELRGKSIVISPVVDMTNTNGRMIGLHWQPSGIGLFRSVNEAGAVVVIHSSTAWRAYLFGGGDSEPQARSWQAICVDPNDTASMLDSSGTFDETQIDGISLLGNTGGTPVFYTCELYYSDPFTLTGGSANRPVTFGDVQAYTSSSMNLINNVQGSAQHLFRAPIRIGDGSADTYFVDEASSIEHPAISNVSTKVVEHHSAENHLGYTFNLASGNVCRISRLPFVTSHKAHWRVTKSTGATLEFNSCPIVGYGDIVHTEAATYTSCAISECDPFAPGASTITDTTFSNASDAALLWTDTMTLTRGTFADNNIGIRVPASGGNKTITLDGDTFSGSTTADVEWLGTSGQTLTVNLTNGANPTTKSVPNSGTITYVQTVTLTVTATDEAGAPLVGAAVYLETDPGGVEVLNGDTNASGIVTGAYAGSTPQAVTGWVRSSSSPTPYRDFLLGGNIGSGGYSATAIMGEDE